MRIRSLILGAALALALPGSASAGLVTTQYDVAVAVGPGGETIRCTRSRNVYDRPFSDKWEWHATTECDAPVEMITEAGWHGGEGTWDEWNFYGGRCDGFRTECVLGGDAQGEYQGGSIRHHVRLGVPTGWRWITARCDPNLGSHIVCDYGS